MKQIKQTNIFPKKDFVYTRGEEYISGEVITTHISVSKKWVILFWIVFSITKLSLVFALYFIYSYEMKEDLKTKVLLEKMEKIENSQKSNH